MKIVSTSTFSNLSSIHVNLNVHQYIFFRLKVASVNISELK